MVFMIPSAKADPLNANDLVIAVLSNECAGISGVGIGNLSDTSTWRIWRSGTAIKATDDVCEGPLIASSIVTTALTVPNVASGITINSTSAPLLNGVYSVNSAAQQNLVSITTYTMLNHTFPGGVMVFPWADITGYQHQGFTIAQFQAFATAVADYVSGIELGEISLLNGQPATWPSSTATIP